jgi:hypothetical protein
MKWLRTIPWFTRLLVGLFLAAQFAGMVSTPRANALPAPAAAAFHAGTSHAGAPPAAHHAHVQGYDGHGVPCAHHDRDGNPADTCCALHACFAGLLPPAVAVAVDTAGGEPLAARPDAAARDALAGRLDRPPRPLH